MASKILVVNFVFLLISSPISGCGPNMGGVLADNAFTTSPIIGAVFSPPANATAANGTRLIRDAVVSLLQSSTDAELEPETFADDVATKAPDKNTPTPPKPPPPALIPQGSSLNGATATLQKDFEKSFDKAVKDLGTTLPTTAKVDYSSLKAAAIHLIGVEAIATAQNGDAVAEGGTVTRTCTGKNSCNEPYKQTGSIKIKDGPFLSGRDWKNLATALQVQLTLIGYKFYSPLVVTA